MLSTNSNYFVHQSTPIVNGYVRTVVLDHERKDYFFIPNELGAILKSSLFIKMSYFDQLQDGGWLKFLEAKEVITQLPSNQFQFRKLPTHYSSPSLISHVKLFGYNELCFESVIENIEKFGCKSLNIVFDENETDLINLFCKLDEALIQSSLTFIQFSLFVADQKEAFILSEQLASTVQKLYRIGRINFLFESKYQGFYLTNLKRTKLPIAEYRTFSSLNLNLQYFIESKHTNSFFNQYIEIGNDAKANIPLGTDLFDLSYNRSKGDFISWLEKNNKIWLSKKDSTDVCKDCEFRHMCVDNRLPYQRTEIEWYHKQECNYNPYIAKWKGEEGYRTLEECGVISNENGFSIDHEKIAKINEELWGEE